MTFIENWTQKVFVVPYNLTLTSSIKNPIQKWRNSWIFSVWLNRTWQCFSFCHKKDRLINDKRWLIAQCPHIRVMYKFFMIIMIFNKQKSHESYFHYCTHERLFTPRQQKIFFLYLWLDLDNYRGTVESKSVTTFLHSGFSFQWTYRCLFRKSLRCKNAVMLMNFDKVIIFM